MSGDSSDDYYVLLGIDADTGSAQLRRTWRRLALQWHPDRAGAGATATFQKLLAAYTVLSDPVARRAYDRRRGIPRRSGPMAPGSRPAPQPDTRRAPAVMLGRLSGPLNALIACGVARRAGDVIELFLTAQEAADGGMATISMRVPVHCPACAANPAVTCARCEGTRVVDELFSAWLAVPPGVSDGAVLTPSVMLRGMVRPVSFQVRLDDGP